MQLARHAVRRGPVVLTAVAGLAAAMVVTPPAATAEPAPPSSAPSGSAPSGSAPSGSAPSGSAPAGSAPAGSGLVELDGVGPGPHTVTLVTGDKVTLRPDGAGYTVRVHRVPRPDGSSPPVFTQSDQNGTFVIPADAVAGIDAGRIDRELFNIEYLAENGYTDEQTGELPLIVQYPGGARSTRVAAQALPASTATVELETIGASGLSVAKAQAGTFWQAVRGDAEPAAGRATTLGAGLARVWLDRKVHATLDESVPLVGAPQAWAAGFDGTGATVAVLDTGIDETHPDLAGKVVASKSFVPGVATAVDGNGHGTHVASTVAGTGAASDGKYTGVAPGADLVIGKVLLDSGTGVTSWIMDGMEWATASGADVVSMSLGGGPTDGTDAFSELVNTLTEQTGTLFVIAAGNSGPGAATVAAPGAADSALTVGATDKADGMANFSSRGPRRGDLGMKPDIAAPGVGIVAARSSVFRIPNPHHVDEHYTRLNGTSMATPHVAGAAAILAVAHPDWTPRQLKTALMSTATDAGHSAYAQGAGRLDVARAISQQVFATTPHLDFGVVPNGIAPVVKQVEYANLSDQPVTLTLTPSLRSDGGEPDGDGLRVDASVTVPAHGTATATVTADPAATEFGSYTGAVVASADGVTLRTPAALLREPEHRTLTIRTLNRDGEPVRGTHVDAVGLNTIMDVTGRFTVRSPFEQVAPGVVRIRVPSSTYSVGQIYGWVDDGYRANAALLTAPEVVIDSDTEITLDARKAVPYEFSTPQRSEQSALDADIQALWQREGDHGWRSTTGVVGANYMQVWALPTEPVTQGKFLLHAQFAHVRPAVEMSVRQPRRVDLHPIEYPHALDALRPQFTAGTHTRTLVDAGSGRPQDLAGLDLRGKLVLLDDDPTDGNHCGVSSRALDRVTAAGATGAVVWPAGEIGSCNALPIIPVALQRFDGADREPLPYVSVPPAEGRVLRGLLAEGPVTLTVTSTPVSPYVYSIAPFEDGRVPDSLHYDLTGTNLAEIDTELHASEPTTFTFTNSLRRGDTFSVSDLSGAPAIVAPATQRHFVGPVDPQVIYSRGASMTGGRFIWEKRYVFDRPARVVERRNAGPAAPVAFTAPEAMLALKRPDVPLAVQGPLAYCSMCRQGDTLWPMARPTSEGVSPGSLLGTHVFTDDGEEIAIQDRKGAVVPAGPGDYRVTWDAEGTTAQWTFHSAGTATEETSVPGVYCWGAHPLRGDFTPCRAEPAVFVAYEFGDSLRLDNTVPAGRTHRFGVTAFHSLSTQEMPRIAGVKVWTSTDDGRTWVPAQVHGGHDGRYSVTARYPRLPDTSGAVSLKVEAWDVEGNRVTQTSAQAFGLRDTRPHHGDPHL